MKTKEFGARLRELRKKAGFSQKELASKIGVNISYISKIESGEKPPPSDKVIRRLTEVLNADKDELITLAGKIPADIAQILKNRETLKLLRSQDSQKKIKTSSKKRGAIPMMNFKNFARVALAFALVVSVGASLWYASPARVKAFSVGGVVQASAISGNRTHLLGEQITIPASLQFGENDLKTITAVSLNISGVETWNQAFSLNPGTYQYTSAGNVSGTLDVVVAASQGVGPSGYKYGYGYSGGSGNLSYSLQWTPPYRRTAAQTAPPAEMPGADLVHSGVTLSSAVINELNFTPDTSWPQGLAYNSGNETMYHLFSGSSSYNSDIIIVTDTSGNYTEYLAAPGDYSEAEAITFIGTTLYAAYNEWDNSSNQMVGKIEKYVSSAWVSISGLANLEPIGGLTSDGTYLYVGYRDNLTIEKRDASTGTTLGSAIDLSNEWSGGGSMMGSEQSQGMGMGMGGGGGGAPIWGFDALVYSDSYLYAAQKDLILQIDISTGYIDNESWTGKMDIRGLAFAIETYSSVEYPILYIATGSGNGAVYKASKFGDVPVLDTTPIGDYTTVFQVVADNVIYTSSSNFTLTKLTTAPIVTVSAPLANFSVGAGSENITVSGTVNDPSISSVSVGIALPTVTAFEDDLETLSTANAQWTHAAVTGEQAWKQYSSEDLWHRSSDKSHGGDYSWRYANSSTGNYETSGKANAGGLSTTNAITIGSGNTLSFWTYYNTEFDFWPDRKIVEVSTDNMTWEPIAWLAEFWPPFMPPDMSQMQYDSLTSVSPMGWSQVSVDLSGYEGSELYLRFRFDTMDDWGNNFGGWYIDDIEITGAGYLGKSTSVTDLAWSTQFTLAEGANTIQVAAARTEYKPMSVGTASVAGSLDTADPIVVIDAVTTPTNSTYQIISGNVTDENFDRLSIYKNGVKKFSTSVLATGNLFSQSILLSEGTNVILVSAVDKAGLSSNTTATIVLDSTGPVFEKVFASDTARYDVAYSTGEVSARPGDSFYIGLRVSDNASALSSVKLVLPQLPPSGWASATANASLPEAVLDSWGFTTESKRVMTHIIPMTLPAGTPAGDYSWSVNATDTAGNSSNITIATTVVTTLEAFNVYLLPDWNLVSTPVIPTTSNITTLTANITDTGLFERVWYYDASAAGTSDEWVYFDPDVGGDLTTISAGKGYWFKMKPLTTTTETSGIDSYTEAEKVSTPMATGLPNTPAPVKLSILGEVLPAGAVAPPSYTVYTGWNLVGLHSELPRPVSTNLQSVTVPEQKWGSLLQYLNYISFPTSAAGGQPEIDLGRFDRLIATDSMLPGRGFWLYMVEGGTIVP